MATTQGPQIHERERRIGNADGFVQIVDDGQLSFEGTAGVDGDLPVSGNVVGSILTGNIATAAAYTAGQYILTTHGHALLT